MLWINIPEQGSVADRSWPATFPAVWPSVPAEPTSRTQQLLAAERCVLRLCLDTVSASALHLPPAPSKYSLMYNFKAIYIYVHLE